ncbi:MAG: class I SAM-dependent methyltransferase [Acidiferrobacterales bacterium]|nr:class I SAM-dependent methyltransferase [Acidiferrobacterales bacterium]
MDHKEWNKRYANKGIVWTVEPNRFLVAEVADLQPGRALDLGCGEGRNAVWLAEQGWQVTAVDFSDIGLDKGRQLASARCAAVSWVLADVTTYRPHRGAYDLVLICYLQLPARERSRVLKHAQEALASHGTLIYIGHDLSNLEHGWGGPQDPAVLCTPQEVVTDLTELQITKAEVRPRRVAREPAHGGPLDATAFDCLVRAVRADR